MWEEGRLTVSEDLASGIGFALLLLIVAAAVGSFILTGMKLGKYEWMEKEEFELCYGIAGMVKEAAKAHGYGEIEIDLRKMKPLYGQGWIRGSLQRIQDGNPGMIFAR